jgi:aminoglycoside phosphotransferase family enzyme/predicted kinase
MAGENSTQAAVVALLGDPATYGRGVGAVKRIDTHAAYVFLAGGRAYKIKRAVKYPYLDYSTLEKREAACRTELEVNRRFTESLYRAVVPIVRGADGRLAFGGAGEPVEWAVEMRRFDEEATLDKVAARAGIDDALARKLGERVAAAHRTAPAAGAAPWIEALGRFVENVARALAAAPEVVPPAEAEALVRAMRSALMRIRLLLVERGKAGFVVQGHGDLHLRNVALIDGEPVLFDAIEFDPVIAAGDVLYDLAFLLMDLVDRKLERAANIVFNRYLVAAGRDEHLDALSLLPFFLSLRAAIRAEVALDKRNLVSGRERADAQGEARDYAGLAARLIAPAKPRLVAVGGLSGTGKSALAAALASFIPPEPGAVHLRSDIERKRIFNVQETQRLPQSAYTPETTERVYTRLRELARCALRAGHSAVVDAVHGRPDEREAIEAVAREAGVAFAGVWLEAPLAARIARVGGRMADASDADAAVARMQESYETGPIAWKKVEASGTLPEVTVAALPTLALDPGSRGAPRRSPGEPSPAE